VRTPTTVGVVGLGTTGLELARVFDELPQADLRWVCDTDMQTNLRAKRPFPGVRTTARFEDLLSDEELDAVVIATPTGIRAELVRLALEAEKHVFTERPLALNGEDADRLVAVAERTDRRLLVEDASLFDPALRKLRELIELERLGEIFYATGTFTDVSELRRRDSVVWTLGCHAVSLLLFLLGDEPLEVSARGDAFVSTRSPDVAFCHLRFATGIVAQLQLSRLDRRHRSRLGVIGSTRMAVYDEFDRERALRIDQTRIVATDGSLGVKPGDVITARATREAPLRLECEHFVAAIRSPRDPAPAHRAATVVNTLEALTHSLDNTGAPTPVRGSVRRAARVVHLATRRP
jgi:predicted dehydrogenase